MSSPTKVYPIPGRFIVGVSTEPAEFDSKAAAEEWLAGETAGVRHDSAFTLDAPARSSAAKADTSNGTEE